MVLTRAELRSWFKLVMGIKALLDALDRQLRAEAAMSHDEYGILSRLYREPGLTMRMGDLAREVGFSPSRLSHAMQRLEEEGWIQRQRIPGDRRIVEAALTEAGTEKVRAVSPDHLAMVRKLVFETLGPDRTRETADAMDEVRRAAQGL
ncbi:MAG TPA: MarR family transcriptional regulator [Acidimicrobiia bacterium]|nr:MarR family transcriptional regulator [Acidimicrobiia bacterium]